MRATLVTLLWVVTSDTELKFLGAKSKLMCLRFQVMCLRRSTQGDVFAAKKDDVFAIGGDVLAFWVICLRKLRRRSAEEIGGCVCG